MSDDDLVAGRYRLGRSLGSGGMGRVWHARDEVLRRSVAIKEVLLPESLAEDEATELRMRTLREARAAARLSHPNVVRIYDVIYADGRPWIVMEYVPSRSLAHVISENGPISPPAAAKVGIAVLDALCAAHDAGVLHRDVKPGNVLLGANGRVVLTDFGLAVYDDLGMQLTQSGIIHGSPQFIAPERALDGTSTQESDMWSLGATLYAAVEGRSPYSRPSSYATLAALATSPPDPPHKAGGLKPVLAGLLRRNPRSRMKPGEVRSRLQRVAADAGKVKQNRGRRQGEAEPPHHDHVPHDGPATAGPEQAPPATTGTPPPEPQHSGTPATGQQQDQSPIKLPIMPEWQQSAGSGTPGTGTGERRSVTPLPRRNPGAFTGAARASTSPPTTPAPAPPPGGPPPPAGRRPGGPNIDDSGVGLIDLVAGLERDDITPMLPYPPPGLPRGRWRSRRVGQVLVIVVLAVAIAATAVAVATRTGHDRGGTAGPIVPPGSHSPSAAPPKPVVMTFPCPGVPPDPVRPVPLGPPTVDGQALLKGFTWFTTDSGTAIPAPVSWSMFTIGTTACFYDPGSQRVLGVTSISTASHDAVSVLRSVRQALFAATGRPPGYTEETLTSDSYGEFSGHWEYTYVSADGPVMHVLTQVAVTKGKAIAYSFEDGDFYWHGDDDIVSAVRAGFTVNLR